MTLAPVKRHRKLERPALRLAPTSVGPPIGLQKLGNSHSNRGNTGGCEAQRYIFSRLMIE